ncbi:MIZ zinc finger domain protein [Aspergillus alliaceus]|uniref:MIZ zinc finger domain protein n=1 Tax=Petromyces alliaceus TaxID=209559 RepID=UPI0012A4345D|nr:uncharacterized protein BDW43DRAFT_303408 [Aspergillus alliaceus]KAB8229130.1 hypothetical protein BDW43DRAFT_303408 [Aspergillus alliaceus]
MSPNHPHLPNICSNANSVESSNSTASIFLGGVRRSWMLNAANNPASPSHSVPTRTSYTDNSATATTTTTTVAADAADWTRQQGMRESSTLRNNAASLTTAPAAPSQLQNAMSPVTPGHPQQQSTVPEPSPWRVVLSDRAGTDPVSTSPAATTAATTPSFSTTTTTVPAAIQRSASYPTPCPVVVPSQAYDSSGNVNRNGASPSVAAFPSPRPTPRSHQSPVGITVSVSSPVGVGARERSGAPQQLQRQGSHVSHSHSPALSPAFPPTVGSPGKQVVQSPVASRRNPFHNTTLDDAFYDRSMSALQVFENQLRQRNCLGNVEQPRAQLLTQACAERDPLLTPQEFFNVPGYTELQARGLDVIRRLLVENSRVSGGFLKWSAQFPAPLMGLIQSSPYREAVEQAGQCLGLLAERWPMYVQQVRSRGNFGITSGPLAYTIFLSTCRTLPGSKNLQYYQQRCASSQTQKVVQAYRSVSETAGIQHPAQSPVLSHGPDRGQRSLRIYVSGNRVYRLRCIKIPPATGEVAESAWSVAESVWPSVLYVHVNGVELFVRRRLHNGKDLPLDITDHLREGENNVSLHFIRSPVETNDMLYAMGIEVLEVSDMARAFSLAQLLPASECREKIRNRVSSRLQDDEISVVSDHLSVNLVDPFTARIFDRPVRGRSCQHQDCFDHLTWIQTRASKSGKRSLKNDWKCPICARDARPQHLVIDGYLQEVHSELARTNRLEVAKAILIKADGSWELKTEADTRVSSERGAENSMGRTASKRKATDNSGHSPSQKTKSERVSSVNGENSCMTDDLR